MIDNWTLISVDEIYLLLDVDILWLVMNANDFLWFVYQIR